MQCDKKDHSIIQYICMDSECKSDRLICNECRQLNHKNHYQKCVNFTKFCETQKNYIENKIKEYKQNYQNQIAKLEIHQKLIDDLQLRLNGDNIKENIKYILSFKQLIKWNIEEGSVNGELSTDYGQSSKISQNSNSQIVIDNNSNKIIMNNDDQNQNNIKQVEENIEIIQKLQKSMIISQKQIKQSFIKSLMNSTANNCQMQNQPKLIQPKENEIKNLQCNIEDLKKKSSFNISQSLNNFDIECFMEGYEYFEKKEFEEATKLFDKAIKENPKNEMAWIYKALSIAEMSRIESAQELIQEIKQLFPQSVDAYQIHGIILEDLQQYKEAFDEYLICTRRNPNSAESHYKAGLCKYQLGEFEIASIFLEKAIKIKIEHQFAQFYLGIIQEHNQNYKQAEIHFRIVISLDRNCSSSYFHLANCLKHQDKYQEALQINAQFQALQPVEWLGYMQKGEIVFLKDGISEAKKIFDQIIQSQPDLSGLINAIMLDLTHQFSTS